jgi:hypothetical protein
MEVEAEEEEQEGEEIEGVRDEESCCWDDRAIVGEIG